MLEVIECLFEHQEKKTSQHQCKKEGKKRFKHEDFPFFAKILNPDPS